MKQFFHNIQQKIFIATAIITMAILASCNAIQTMEDEAECAVGYYVRFQYNWNLKYADAFAHEVKTVTVYVFNPDGLFVAQKTESGERLADDNYSMKLDIAPGEYHLIAWAGMDGESFTAPVLTPSVSTIADLTVKAHRLDDKTVAGNNTETPEKLNPLWHGEVQNAFGSHVFYRSELISLIKDTNTLRVILMEQSGSVISSDMFDVRITADNGWMNYDNTLLTDDMLSYIPYHTEDGIIENEGNQTGSTSVGNISFATAELSTARLLTDKGARLRILNKETGNEVVNISLTQYLLLTKQTGHQMSDQEYLDRQDEAAITFILNKNLSWISTIIQVDKWTIRLNNTEL